MVMTHEEIVRWFRKFRYDPQFLDENGSHAVPIRNFCDLAGVARQNFYAMVRGDVPLTANMERRLTAVIQAVQAGLRWRRRAKKWEIVDEKYLRHMPIFDNEKHRQELHL